MLSTVDLLRVVERNGPLSLGELESTIPEPADGSNDGFWILLDAAMDHGYLRCTGNKHGLAGGYRLTQRGRGALNAAVQASMAA